MSTTSTIFTTAVGGIVMGFALSSIWSQTFQSSSSTTTTAPSKASSDTGSSNTKMKLMHTAINKVKLLQAASKAHTQELASTNKKGTLD